MARDHAVFTGNQRDIVNENNLNIILRLELTGHCPEVKQLHARHVNNIQGRFVYVPGGILYALEITHLEKSRPEFFRRDFSFR